MKFILLMPYYWGTLFLLGFIGLLFIFIPFNDKFIKSNAKIIIGLSTLFSLGLVSLYGYWGQSKNVLQLAALDQIDQTLTHLNEQKVTTKEEILAEFAQLEKNIDTSAAALSKLGRIYYELGIIDKSIAVLDQALLLAPSDLNILEQWVLSHSLLNQGRLPPKVREITMRLVQENHSVNAFINILAIDDYFHGKYLEAIQQWRLLLETDEELSDEKRAVLHNAIRSAKQHQASDVPIAQK